MSILCWMVPFSQQVLQFEFKGLEQHLIYCNNTFQEIVAFSCGRLAAEAHMGFLRLWCKGMQNLLCGNFSESKKLHQNPKSRSSGNPHSAAAPQQVECQHHQQRSFEDNWNEDRFQLTLHLETHRPPMIG